MDSLFIPIAGALMVLGGLIFWLGQKMKRFFLGREKEKRGVDSLSRKAEFDANEHKKTLDNQLNHGRMIFNWLKRELGQYKQLGIKLYSMDDNGGKFSIFIEKVQNEYDRLPILQVTYDFVNATVPYLGHIHYGRYGADILFWVGDHAPKSGLDRLVLDVVKREAESIKTRSAAP
ncbi:MAG: hypothetical protein M3Q24_01605 [bacterium]|nr:hypothetical protein [bacterium]